ncbi:hypothetical protein M5X17_27380 [Paenibacillus alvei]|uniref:hypothetical protein n=1 Tax=Paenibacillus alvei TaxID=44250 RepID=UPI002280EDC2|nr:hypothetical protein [Paenibacillus alvei]MCY9737427.1 hypothetical protein [Paenibacillus alvei]
MDFCVVRNFQNGDKALFPYVSGDKTYMLLVKIDDISKVENTSGNMVIYYKAFIYDSTAAKDQSVPDKDKYKSMTVEESKLITIDKFNTEIIADF